MAHAHSSWSYSTLTGLTLALALAAPLGCGGSENAPPKAPEPTSADMTQTTGAATGAGTGMAPSPTPSRADTTAASGTGSSGGMGSASAFPPAADTSSAAAGSMGAGGKGDASAMTDEQIAAVTNAANAGEVDQAKEAVKKAKSSKVKQFAQHMITDHGAAYKQQNDILRKANLTASDNPTAQQIATDGKQVLSTLQSATGGDFDKQYMDAQVKEHQQVLDTLDNKLIPNAKNAELKSFLQNVRGKIAGHLKMAQEVQSSLK